jgi:hypothetical protein
MKKITIAASFLLFLGITLQAQQRKSSRRQNDSQSYTTAAGIKFYPGAISIKHFVNEKNAIEGLGYFWDRGGRITGLFEIHGDINGADGLKWYIGPGAHIGFYNAWVYNNKNYNRGTYFGIDGVLGLDYKIKNAPLNISLDWQPSFEFGYGPGFTGNWGGLGIRYVFK